MWNYIKNLAFVLTLCFSLTSAVYAQNFDAVTINAVVVDPITVAATAALDFGTVAGSSSGTSTVVQSAAVAAPTTTGGALIVTAGAAGGFTVDCATGQTVSFSTNSPRTVTNGTPADDMTVDTFTFNAAQACNGTPRAQLVGGTLHLAQNQTAGSYTGTVTVTAVYN